ncbi:MAG: Abi family protein [Prevotella sp.]|nr:Abi family protein [Prevotella sp.]
MEEQIVKLKGRGMVFEDENKAKEILLDVGYYRLGFYSYAFEKSFPRLKHRTHELIEGTEFRDVVELYYFDCDLRRLLTYYVNRIEVNIRTQITYIISNHYVQDPTWFANPKVMRDEYVNKFYQSVYKDMAKNPVLARHHKKYLNDKYAPAWKTLEFMTLGNIIHLYLSLKDRNLQNKIAKHYNCSFGVFCDYLEIIRSLRNRCAHGNCLYNMILYKGIQSSPAGITAENRHNIAGVIGVVRYILGQISNNRLAELDNNLKTLLGKERPANTNSVIKKCTGL